MMDPFAQVSGSSAASIFSDAYRPDMPGVLKSTPTIDENNNSGIWYFINQNKMVDDKSAGSMVNDSSSGSMVKDTQADEIQKLATDLGIKLSPDTLDYLMTYYLNERSAENAHKRSMDASSTQYQRAVADLQKAGINPMLALGSLSGSSPSSASGGVSGGYSTSRSNQSSADAAKVVGSIMSVVAIVAAAVIAAL